jgi:two-component system cell cycle sensor histidine kinase PleC
VKGLLLLARVEAGTEALTKEKLYFDEIVIEAISRVERLSRQKQIQIHFDISNQTTNESFHPMTWGEADLLREVVYNLLENATKYSPASSTIRVKLVWTENTQSLTIEDSGPGIPEDQLQIMFERFSRGAHVGQKGFGLGLAIAQKIAEAHNARIWMKNRAGVNGSVFHFEIKNI